MVDEWPLGGKTWAHREWFAVGREGVCRRSCWRPSRSITSIVLLEGLCRALMRKDWMLRGRPLVYDAGLAGGDLRGPDMSGVAVAADTTLDDDAGHIPVITAPRNPAN